MAEQTIHILVIEDEESHAELMRRAFASHTSRADARFHLTTVDSLTGARAQLAQSIPDLVIADLLLPDGRGIELLPASEDGPPFPMVVMTSYGNEQVAVDAIKAGALDYVVKSVTTLNDMPHVAERALRQWDNIIERRRAEKALRESEERYRSLFNNVPAGIYRTTPGGEFLDVNPALVEMLGYPDRETLLALNTADMYVNPETRRQRQALIERTGVVRDFEARFRRHNGTIIWVRNTSRAIWDGEGQVLYYEGTLEDITERKQAEKEIRRRAAHLEALNAIIAAAGAAPNLKELLEIALDRTLHALSTDKGAIWLADEQALQGFPPDMAKVAGRTAQDAEADIPGAITVKDWQQIEEGNSFYAMRPQMTRFDIRASITVPIMTNEERTGGLSLAACEPRSWSSEEVALVEAVGRQLGTAAERLRLLHEVRRQAEELEGAVARLQELDRLKSEFIQNASHELRTPLALVRGYAEMLATGELGELKPAQQEPIAVINRRAHMLSDLVEDITLILEAEVKPPNPDSVPMDLLIQAAVEDFHVSVDRAGLELHTQIEPGLPPVSGTPIYLRRVLDNLLANAIKFTPSGGRINVEAYHEKDYVQLKVSDTGIGIPSDRLIRIFDRFYQVDGSSRRRYGGVGLGLALVKEIIEAYGGHVAVESELGEGSTFTIALLVAEETKEKEEKDEDGNQDTCNEEGRTIENTTREASQKNTGHR